MLLLLILWSQCAAFQRNYPFQFVLFWREVPNIKKKEDQCTQKHPDEAMNSPDGVLAQDDLSFLPHFHPKQAWGSHFVQNSSFDFLVWS